MAMDHSVCPGSKKIRVPTPETARCPSCGHDVEIWTDERRAECRRCKTTVMRKIASSCLDWCAMGKECVGEGVYNTYMKNRPV